MSERRLEVGRTYPVSEYRRFASLPLSSIDVAAAAYHWQQRAERAESALREIEDVIAYARSDTKTEASA